MTTNDWPTLTLEEKVERLAESANFFAASVEDLSAQLKAARVHILTLQDEINQLKSERDSR
jgi:outer membrane murein-binding lipoprotein Lpp